MAWWTKKTALVAAVGACGLAAGLATAALLASGLRGDGRASAGEPPTMDEKLVAFRAANFPDGVVDICLRNDVATGQRSAAFTAAFHQLPALPVSKAFGFDKLQWRVDDQCQTEPPYDPVSGATAGWTIIEQKTAYDAYVYVVPQVAAGKLGDLWVSRLMTQDVYQPSPDVRSPATMAVIIGDEEFKNPRITLHLVARALGLAGAQQDGRLGLDNACTKPDDLQACGRDYLAP